MAIRTYPAVADLEVIAPAPPPAVAPDVLARIEVIWSGERARRGPKLFNGRLFSVTAIDAQRLTGTIVPYSWFVAQRRDPDLFTALKVRPLAVNGVLFAAGGIVFGRRAAHLEQDAGLWEPVPAGGVDGRCCRADGSLDVAGQLVAELAEEVGLTQADLLAPPRPVAIVEDPSTQVTIIAMVLRTALGGDAIATRFGAHRSDEYTDLRLIATERLAAHLSEPASGVSDGSAALLRAVLPLIPGT